MCGRTATRRHNQVCEVLFSFFKDAGFAVTRERSVLPFSSDNTPLPHRPPVPGDLSVPSWTNGDTEHVAPRDTLFDITIVNSLASSVVQSCSNNTMFKLNLAAKEKIDSSRSNCEANGLAFYPMVFDVSGGCDHTTAGILKRLAALLSFRLSQPLSVVLNRVRTAVSCAIQRANGQMLNERRVLFLSDSWD